MAKFYGVKVGKQPGVYTDWASCEAQVKGFKGAKYASFPSEEEARNFVEGTPTKTEEEKPISEVKTPTENVDVNELRKKGMEAVDFLQNNNLILGSMADRIRKQVELSCNVLEASQADAEARGGKPYPSHVDVFVDGSYNSETNDYGYGVYINDGEKQQILYGRGVCQAGGRNIEGEVQASRRALDYVSLNPQYKSCTIYHDYQGIGSWADKEWSTNKIYTTAYANFVEKIREKGLDVKFVHVDGHTGVEGNEYVDKLAKIGCGVPLTNSEKNFIEQLKNVPGFPKTMSMPEPDAISSYSVEGDYMPEGGM